MFLAVYIVVFLVSIITSFFGTSVGGAGLIVIPVLIVIGLEPQEAVATSVFSYIGIASIGWYAFHQKKEIAYAGLWQMTCIFSVGVIVGAYILLQLQPEDMKKIIALFILVLVPLVFLTKGSGIIVKKTSSTKKAVGYISMFPLGIHAGLMGGGTSTLVTYVLILCFGQTFVQSAGSRKPIFLVRTIISLVIYIPAGLIVWGIGWVQMIGMAIGSYFGANYAVKKGSSWVKNVYMVVAVVLAIKMLV